MLAIGDSLISSHNDQPVGVGVIRQELATAGGNEHHILVLHAESKAGFIDERLDADHHSVLKELVFGRPEVRIFVQVQTDAVSDKGDRRQPELAELAEIELINRTGRCAGPDGTDRRLRPNGRGHHL